MSIQNLIENLVNNKVKNQELFTAFDITHEARKLRTDKVMHNEVRDIVHDMFMNNRMPSYTRELGSFPNLVTQPWVYHHVNNDILDYGNTVVNPSPSVPSFTTPATSDDSYPVDARGTLCIPKKMVESLGCKAGDQIFVYVNANSLILKKFGDSTFCTSYTVDKNVNVRVTQSALAAAGLAGNRFTIEVDNDFIKVKA